MSSTCQSCNDRAGCREVRPALVADVHGAGGARTAGLLSSAGDTVARARSLEREFRAFFSFLMLLWFLLLL